jgi:hypothetical protein
MSKIWGKRPSPSLVISILALFVALGGSAYAASKIGTKNIRNNAITAAKIKKNAITTAKIKDDAVTGAKVQEASLGPVPNATNAVNAESAINAISAVKASTAANFDRYYTSGLRKASAGETVPLGAIGPFTFVGKCEDLGGGNYNAGAYMLTSQPGSFMYSTEGVIYAEGNLNPGTEARLGNDKQGTSPYWYAANGYESDWSAASPDGSLLLQGFADVGVHVFGADCAFELNWFQG